MVTIVWNPLRFQVLAAPPKCRTFDVEYYHENILTALGPLRPEGGGDLSFIQTMQRRILVKSMSWFVPKTGWDSPHTPY
jgi:hypothetical protein